ncbi:MAG: Co2+/Mg2+ efflux protein ApaG [Candidatus Thiodiazotropha sp. (ex Dulcina madagascariensis)]|nr:Co2+/Mg2+ efflux protein ApaG [Candidatus Thiodiazotropha sp. (ex Epidulcina cf. delphinae)]MCU7936098.1 Co2+/Mg2+ efflux protein ApaG [Candidatus Thiodiazotropha sp. (ex Dulcina madagascariensis)]
MEKESLHHIDVKVETRYVESQSLPHERRFVFSYTVTIRNDGSTPARLLNRHWIITDANGKIQEVRGEGVVGEQPQLNPGETFRYTSGTILDTPVGSMQGSYDMIDGQGNHFDALIPPFSLARPGSLH